MPKVKKNFRVYQYNLSEITGLSIRAIRDCVKREEVDMDDLTSIAYFIVKKTIEPPKPKDKKGPPTK